MALNKALGQQIAHNTNNRANKYATQLPGYSQFNNMLGGGDGTGIVEGSGGSSNYAQQYLDQFNPADMMAQLGLGQGGNGSGDYGPIGASQLKDFGEGAYQLFDKFKPGMEYIAENQGVGEQELANMLGTSSSGYQANIANQNAQAERQMGRMGIDPTSGAYAAGAGSRAMQGAAGMSGLQQNVRQGARQQDWAERMQAAGIGLQAGQQGTDALGKATGACSNALNAMSGLQSQYMSGYGQMLGMDEQARQFGLKQKMQVAQGLTGARPAFDNTNLGGGMNNAAQFAARA